MRVREALPPGRARFAAVFVLFVTCAPAAWALDDDALIREGIAQRRAGDDRAALKSFQRAYEIKQTPRALGQIGLAEQAIGHWAAADRHLRQALQSTNDPWIGKNRGSIEEALGVIASHVGQLDVSGTPSGAEVRIDGELAGQLPLPGPLTVTAGGVALEVRAPGHVPIVRATTVGARALTREAFTLQPIAPTAGGGSAMATPLATGSTEAAFHSQASVKGGNRETELAAGSEVAAAPDDSGSGRRLMALGSAGLAAASLAFAIVEHLSWQNKANEFSGRRDCGTTFPEKGGAGCSRLYDDGQQARTLAFIGYGLTAGFAATATVLYLTAPDRRGQPRQVACAPFVTTAGLACGLRF